MNKSWGIIKNRIIWKDVKSFEMNFKKDDFQDKLVGKSLYYPQVKKYPKINL